MRYSLQCLNNGKGRWRCVKQRNGCRAIVVTHNGVFQYVKNDHNHPREMGCKGRKFTDITTEFPLS
ncbi:unnamed protein product, partial [Iphiclides podalirius]